MNNNLLKKLPVAFALAIFCQTLWGVVFPFIKKCYELFNITDTGSTLLFASIRFIIAGLILLTIESIREKRVVLLDSSNCKQLLFLGTIQTGLTYGLQFIAMIKASSINCSILNGTSFIFMNISAHFMFKDDRMNLRKILGAIVGFSGILVCFLSDSNLSSFSLGGEGIMLLSIISFAVSTSISRKITTGIKPIIASGYSLLIGGLELLILSSFMSPSLNNGGVLGYSYLLLLALTSSICLMLWTTLVSLHGVGKIAVFQCVNPITGAIAAAFLLKEDVLQPKYIISIILVCIAIIIVNTNRKLKA